MAANDIARWIIRYRADTSAPVDQMSLQKLMFYAQAFCLARHGEALFSDRFEAWRHGPVFPAVWRDFPPNEGRAIVPDENEPTPHIGRSEQEACLRQTVQFFSRLSTFSLSDATHHEAPWLEARGDRAWDENSDEIIPTDHIRTYYAELIADGEEAFSRHEVLDIVPEPRLGNYYTAGICVRRMTSHPLYRMDWTEALLAPVSDEANWPRRVFAPMTRREFVRVTSH